MIGEERFFQWAIRPSCGRPVYFCQSYCCCCSVDSENPTCAQRRSSSLSFLFHCIILGIRFHASSTRIWLVCRRPPIGGKCFFSSSFALSKLSTIVCLFWFFPLLWRAYAHACIHACGIVGINSSYPYQIFLRYVKQFLLSANANDYIPVCLLLLVRCPQVRDRRIRRHDTFSLVRIDKVGSGSPFRVCHVLSSRITNG